MTDDLDRSHHHMYETSIHTTWKNMRQRCSNPNVPWYEYYGGRGITVCDRWQNSFMAFYRDMGEEPEGSCIERIDNDCGYFLENCRWATPAEQVINTRTPKGSLSGFKGVTWHKLSNQWSAQVTYKYTQYHIGTYQNVRLAAEARDKFIIDNKMPHHLSGLPLNWIR